jgi:sulfur-oxidizing protein SoxY
MQIGRRLFLKGTVALAALLTLPRALRAAVWPASAFGATDASNAMKELFGTDQTAPSGEITLGAPEIAENGAVVPISIETTLKNVESVSIVVDKNPRPLAISFEIPPGTRPNVACRIKMGETSPVRAVVKTPSAAAAAESPTPGCIEENQHGRQNQG